MKFSYLHKAFSFALSFLVLFSTLSLTIDKHFCGDVLIDVAIFSESKNCGIDISKAEQTEVVEKSCCKNEIDVIEGPSDLTINSFEDLEFSLQQVLFAYSYSYINLFEGLPSLVIPHSNYLPPTLVEDIHLLDEVYLI
ncbi:HYC_CC_PP family protein [Winogradskyella pacifica]|uniref:HYC_CC_PP family protein n=1 Tax=Winogradskyella pacifica TaxID=664642 RepID=UPI0015CAC883